MLPVMAASFVETNSAASVNCWVRYDAVPM